MGAKKRVLICDDSLLVRKKLRDSLEEMNCEVCEATNGKVAVDVFKEKQPDVVFMDIVMPEADGLEALKNIKEYDADARIIMLSSTGTSAKLIQALKGGAVDFIQKPYTVEQIEKVISSLPAK
ncbi:MAG: response regulator [Pelosinus sp.]|nr:response regulator [Pelosinus sp.]